MLKLCVLLLGIFICVTESTICTSHDAMSKQIEDNCHHHSPSLSNINLGKLLGSLSLLNFAIADAKIEVVVLKLHDATSNKYGLAFHAVIRLGNLGKPLVDVNATITANITLSVKGGCASLALLGTASVDVKIKGLLALSLTLNSNLLVSNIKATLIGPFNDFLMLVINTCNEQNKNFNAVYALGNNLQCHNEITSIESKPGYLVSRVTTFIGSLQITWESIAYKMNEGQSHSMLVHKKFLNSIFSFLGLGKVVFEQSVGLGSVNISGTLISTPECIISESGLTLGLLLSLEFHNGHDTLFSVEVNATVEADLTYINGHIGIVISEIVLFKSIKWIPKPENCECPELTTILHALVKKFVNGFCSHLNGKLKVKIPLALPVGTPGTPVTPGPVTPCKPHPVISFTSRS
ncbi:uncharacterized protein LOC142094976 isoform X2 [Mixophyes fleayi]|uniref:uncharacterized protein LOC142094976 isoform X2 n=1 Tax=Mixophyes fleayi TaxID=3061075 RepID=UPI003F4DDB85